MILKLLSMKNLKSLFKLNPTDIQTNRSHNMIKIVMHQPVSAQYEMTTNLDFLDKPSKYIQDSFLIIVKICISMQRQGILLVNKYLNRKQLFEKQNS